MLSETQDTRYFERMASSLGDKETILPHVIGNRVLDVGAGGGELAEAIRLTGREVWALDGSHAAAKRMAEAYPDLHLLTGLANEVGYLAPQAHFSTIVCSSIFHEVYSYGIPETGPYSIEAMKITYRALFDVLAPGGRLILRDGIMPSDWDKPVQIRFPDEDGPRFWGSYVRNAPFASWAGDGQRCVHLSESDEQNSYTANLESAMEFLYTYTWGWQSSAREMKELYGVFTEATYREFLTELGFTVLASGQYLQPGYYEHLKDKVQLLDAEGNPQDYPASNFILVAEKPH